MGKYIKKSKGKGVTPIVEVNHAKTSLGVLTRSKTLALQHSSSIASTAIGDGKEGESYLQLRSRRLEKFPIGTKGKTQKQHKKYSNSKSQEKGSSNRKQESEKDRQKGQIPKENKNEKKNNSYHELEVVEASSGEDVLEFGSRGRTTRESTPINLIRDLETTITPPGSSTRRRPNTNIMRANSMQLHIPTTTDHQLDEIFARAEEKEKNKFIEKYNFDPMKDEPLPGRYEWEKLKP